MEAMNSTAPAAPTFEEIQQRNDIKRAQMDAKNLKRREARAEAQRIARQEAEAKLLQAAGVATLVLETETQEEVIEAVDISNMQSDEIEETTSIVSTIEIEGIEFEGYDLRQAQEMYDYSAEQVNELPIDELDNLSAGYITQLQEQEGMSEDEARDVLLSRLRDAYDEDRVEEQQEPVVEPIEEAEIETAPFHLSTDTWLASYEALAGEIDNGDWDNRPATELQSELNGYNETLLETLKYDTNTERFADLLLAQDELAERIVAVEETVALLEHDDDEVQSDDGTPNAVELTDDMSKAEKIRMLWATGDYTKSQIAKTVGTYYQHVHGTIQRLEKQSALGPVARCRICGKALMNPAHAALGIGPICEGKHNKGKSAK